MAELNRIVTINLVTATSRLTGLQITSSTGGAADNLHIGGTVFSKAWRSGVQPEIRPFDRILYMQVQRGDDSFGQGGSANERTSGFWPKGTELRFLDTPLVTRADVDFSTVANYGGTSDRFLIASMPIEFPDIQATELGPAGDGWVLVEDHVRFPLTKTISTERVWAQLDDESGTESTDVNGDIIKLSAASWVVRYDERLLSDVALLSEVVDDEGRTWEIVAIDRVGYKDYLVLKVQSEVEAEQ